MYVPSESSVASALCALSPEAGTRQYHDPRLKRSSVMANPDYEDAVRLIEQLRANLDDLAAVPRGSREHREAVTRFNATFAALSRNPFTKPTTDPLPK
jgi:hypothetical protein